MAKFLQDDAILDLIGDGKLSEIEVESEAEDMMMLANLLYLIQEYVILKAWM